MKEKSSDCSRRGCLRGRLPHAQCLAMRPLIFWERLMSPAQGMALRTAEPAESSATHAVFSIALPLHTLP